MAEPLVAVRGLSKSFGGLRATDRVDLDVPEGETHAVIGPNGAGKTTLIGQLAGDLRPDAGTTRFAGRDVTPLDAAAQAKYPSRPMLGPSAGCSPLNRSSAIFRSSRSWGAA